MRPVYQTPADQRAERETAAQLRAAWGWELSRFPALSEADWLAHKAGRIVAVVELKTRTHLYGRYDTYLLSAHKWVDVRALAHVWRVEPVLVIRFGNGELFWADLDVAKVVAVQLGGRRDRGDPQDVEPCVHLPIDQLRKVIPRG